MLQAAERAIEDEKERIMLQLKMSEQEARDSVERNKFLKAGLAVAGVSVRKLNFSEKSSEWLIHHQFVID